jgi:hypothetical protein
MGVHVDEARGNQQAFGVDLFGPCAKTSLDSGDRAADDPHIGQDRIAPAAVDDQSAPDH